MCDDVSSLCSEVLRSAMAQKAVGMGLEPSVVEKSILEKISKTGSDYSTLEQGTVSATCHTSLMVLLTTTTSPKQH